jgi:hypothetical protein
MNLNNQRFLKMENQNQIIFEEETKSCFQTFYKKEEMYFNLSQTEHIRNKTPECYNIYLSSDIKPNHGGKKFHFCENIYDFLDEYKNYPDDKKCFYEIIKDDRPCKLYFDLDYKIVTGGCNKGQYLFQCFEDLLCDFLRETFPKFNEKKLEYFILEASNDIKISLHIICPTFIFQNKNDIKAFMNLFRHFFENNNGFNPDTGYTYMEALDWCVYDSDRSFRIIGSSKLGQKRPLRIPDWHTNSKFSKNNIQNFFVTNINNTDNFIQINEKWKNKKFILNKKTDQVKLKYNDIQDIEKHIPEIVNGDELEYLLNIIPYEVIDEYDSWFKLIYCLKKLGVPDERIHEISSQSDKYDESYTNSIINNFDASKNSMTINTLRNWCGVSMIKGYNSKFPMQCEMISHDCRDDNPYLWFDFINDYCNKIFNSEKEMKDEIFPLFPKMFSYVHCNDSMVYNNDPNEWSFKKPKLFKFSASYKVVDDKKEKIIPFTINSLFEKYQTAFPNYARYVFKPNNHGVKPGELNLWRGFQAKQVDEVDMQKIQLFLNHILEVWANDNEDHYDYIISWLAHIVKTPYKKTMIALLIHSDQGAGKTIITDFLFKFLFGRINSAITVGLDKLVQRFNSYGQAKIFVNINEMSSCSDTYSNVFDKMKALITDDFQTVENKGIDPFTIDNNCNYLLCTNHDYSVKIEQSDRRYAVFSCSNKYCNNREYFNNLINSLDQDCADHLFTYLLNYNITRNIRDIPDTEIRKSMKSRSLNSVEYYIECLLDPNNDELRQGGGDTFKFDKKQRRYITNRNLFHNYICFCEMEHISKKLNYQTFIKIVNRKIKQNFKKIDGKNKRVYYIE